MIKEIKNYTDFETIIETIIADDEDIKNFVIYNHTNAHGQALTIGFMAKHMIDNEDFVIDISVGYADDNLGSRISFYHDEESPIGLKFPWQVIQQL